MKIASSKSRSVSVPITCVCDDGSFSSNFSSINEAVKLLEIKKTTLIRYINILNHSIYSPALDKNVFIVDPSKPKTVNKPLYPNNSYIKKISDFNKGSDIFIFDSQRPQRG